MPPGQTPAAPQAPTTIGDAARVDAPPVRRAQPSPTSGGAALGPPAAASRPAATARVTASRAPGAGAELPRRRTPPGRLGRLGGDDVGGQRAEDCRHAAQTGIPTETRAGRRDLFAPAPAPTAQATVFLPHVGRRRCRCRRWCRR